MNTVQRLMWIFWFLACITRIRWVICCVCLIGIIMNLYYLVQNDAQKQNFPCWVAIVFYSVVMISNMIFVLTR